MSRSKTWGWDAGGMAVLENLNNMEDLSRAYHSPFKNKDPFKKLIHFVL